MKIVIIGAGAMGGLFAVRLAAAGETVAVVDLWQEHIAAIARQGLKLETAEGTVTGRPAAATSAAGLEAADLVVIFVKSAETKAATLSALPLLGSSGRILTLQNGLGNAETIASVTGAERVLAGTTAQGATLLGPGLIRHGGRGDTHIGRLSGKADDFCREVAGVFSRAGIPTRVEDGVQSLIWGKLIINAGINALTALLKYRNGQLAECAETSELLEMAVTEAVQVAAAAGIQLPYENPAAKVLAVAAATAANQSSMLQDILHGRSTEIDAINGAIVREGERHGVPVPVNRTLTLLVRALEKQAGIG